MRVPKTKMAKQGRNNKKIWGVGIWILVFCINFGSIFMHFWALITEKDSVWEVSGFEPEKVSNTFYIFRFISTIS